MITRKAHTHRRPTTPTLAAPITDRKVATSITAIISMMGVGVEIEMVIMKKEKGGVGVGVGAGVRDMAGVEVEEGVRKGVGAETGTGIESGVVIHSKTECRCRGDSIVYSMIGSNCPLYLS